MEAAGWATSEKTKPLRTEDECPICSISKLFVANVILGLAEEKRVKVTETAGLYLDWLKIDAQSVTLNQLLTHSSGPPNMDDAGTKSSDGFSDLYFETLPKLKSLKNRIFAVLTEKKYRIPDLEFSYNNLDFLLLEAVIEKVTGNSFIRVISERILKPVKMAKI